MSETNNKAKMAVQISNEIFSSFGWTYRPLRDSNWDCVSKKHNKATHPADVVFTYDDPFLRPRVYVLSDLKSYGKTSITWSKLKLALTDLAMSLDCATRSPGFRSQYVVESDNFNVIAMLFVFNNDNKYEKSIESMLKDIDSQMIGLRAGLKLFVINPERICYLQTVANDLDVQRGKQVLPHPDHCAWVYPDLKLSHPKVETGPALSLETLIGPWQILKYSYGGVSKDQDGVFVYYDGPGDSPDEFAYLLDSLFQFQLVKKSIAISIRMPNAVPLASVNFEKGKEKYALEFFPAHELLLERLKSIGFHRLQTIQPNYSEFDFGMEDIHHE